MNEHSLSTRFSPPKLLVLGFAVMIVAGTALLMIPRATVSGISLVDALFTATSAVCVTGLIVKSTPADFTSFGQVVILVLIQAGGLGYMSVATLFALIIGKRIGLAERLLIKESLHLVTLSGIVRFMKGMLIFVFLCEAAGTVVFTFSMLEDYPLGESLFTGLFHAVSAFNNAGFSLFEDSFIRYRGDLTVNLMLMGLIVLGGIGFVAVSDLQGRLRGHQERLMIHTRLVLLVTTVFIAGGAFLVYFGERGYLFALPEYGGREVYLSSLFASVTARTAGFYTIDYSLLQPATIFLTIMLMIVGASPGGTGGGVKTTTLGIIVLNIWHTLRGKGDTVIFRRKIPDDLVLKSYVILALAMLAVTVVTFIIMDIERTPFLRTLFEVVSAFGTVGLTSGDGAMRSFCATFSDVSKVLIVGLMLAGRLGPLTLFMALMAQQEERVHYPEGRVMIG